MTRDDALMILGRSGLHGADARTSLAHALVGFDDIDEMLAVAKDMEPNKLWTRFGQDGGRAVMILRKNP